MKRPIVIKVLSGLLNLLVCYIAATIVLYYQDWFGSGDLDAFITWTVPLAVALSVSGSSILALFRLKNVVLRIVLAIVASALLSFGFVYVVYMFLGPYINAFSIPIMYLWIPGCLSQLLFLDWFLPKKTREVKISVALINLLKLPAAIVLTIGSMYLLLFAINLLSN